MTVTEHDVGWVVEQAAPMTGGNDQSRRWCSDPRAAHAAEISRRYDFESP